MGPPSKPCGTVHVFTYVRARVMHSESISRYTATAFGNIKQVVDNEIIQQLLTLRFRSTTGGSGVAMAKYVKINAAHRKAIPVAFNALLKEQSPCVEVRESLNMGLFCAKPHFIDVFACA